MQWSYTGPPRADAVAGTERHISLFSWAGELRGGQHPCNVIARWWNGHLFCNPCAYVLKVGTSGIIHVFCSYRCVCFVQRVQRAIHWATDDFCCSILEQKRWTAEKETCLCVWFSHSMRGTSGKQLPLYRQRCLVSAVGKRMALPQPPRQYFCSCKLPPYRQAGERCRRGGRTLPCLFTLVAQAHVNRKGLAASVLVIIFLLSMVLPCGMSTGF